MGSVNSHRNVKEFIMRSLQQLTRPNIWDLAPYSSARNEYSGHVAHVFLDANENPYNDPYNRYPDPLQQELKERLSQVKNVPAQNIFLGNGSDEAIDLVYRCFCQPRKDNVVAICPTYGMYEVCADINDVEYRPVELDEDYCMSAEKVLAACDANTKAIWICSPNNPTGNSIDRDEIAKVVTEFDGIVVIDEAYIDFSRHGSLSQLIHEGALIGDKAVTARVIILQTMSKAWGSAAIRLGMAFAAEEIIGLFNKVKYPYNVNQLTQEQALRRLSDTFAVEQWVKMLIQERGRMIEAFEQLPLCTEVYPTDANFILIKVVDAQKIYDYLVDKGIIVRNRTRVTLCHNCLRVTIGTREENNELLAALRKL